LRIGIIDLDNKRAEMKPEMIMQIRIQSFEIYADPDPGFDFSKISVFLRAKSKKKLLIRTKMGKRIRMQGFQKSKSNAAPDPKPCKPKSASGTI